MFAGLKMRKDFKVISSQTALSEAARMLERERIWVVLAIDEGRLVGYLRREDVSAALPAQPAGGRMVEDSFQAHRLTVAMAMRKNIMPVPPETEIEAAARIMHDSSLAALAVVDGNGEVLGYLNHEVMLEVLVDDMGGARGGCRLVFEAEDRPGVLHEVTGVACRRNVNIISTSVFQHGGRSMVVLRLDGGDDDRHVRREIESLGYRLENARDFTSEWTQESIQ
ncbi:CBS domain-containing protein [Fundidesulfovibrio soli]|uniref:CBS domain-containing protein n=1 Tax=Fundidesulfovibrio soli TaxID=2922716 RepID=UPI001FAFC117|nr:CBS domain-containing protein [Fundidesulfovibrio soli]